MRDERMTDRAVWTALALSGATPKRHLSRKRRPSTHRNLQLPPIRLVSRKTMPQRRVWEM
jgi:hypothetical protein